ncbi:MAG TPA: N-formylglutamate amidohydrolase, partial [Streptosporangiaceae bacterium]
TITTAFSRFVADVNRDPDGEQHGSFWSSVVPACMPTGEPAYRRSLSSSEIRHRIRLAHEPFHQALDTAIDRLLNMFPRILLLDLHSFGVPLDGDIILGDRRGATARPAAMRLVADAFAGKGFTVHINRRFIGGWTIRRFTADDRVDAIQVELNQRCYLAIDEHRYQSPPPLGAFEPTRQLLRSVFAGLDMVGLLAGSLRDSGGLAVWPIK